MKNIFKNAKNAFLIKKILYVLMVVCLISVLGNLAIMFSNGSISERLALAVIMALLFGLYIILRKFLFDLPRHFFPKEQVSPSAQEAINNAIGPSPWYWKTFPPIRGNQRNRYVWNHHGNRGKFAYLVSLSAPNDNNNL